MAITQFVKTGTTIINGVTSYENMQWMRPNPSKNSVNGISNI